SKRTAKRPKIGSNYYLPQTDSIIQPVTPAISHRITPSSYSTPLFDTTEELNQEIAKLRIETRDIASKLEMTKKESVKYRKAKANLESKIDTRSRKSFSLTFCRVFEKMYSKRFMSQPISEPFLKTRPFVTVSCFQLIYAVQPN
ncbi:hypothetical protein LCGC14_2170270, partial [marine sediment metagenome]